MASIASIVKARKGSAGSGNAWRVESFGECEYQLWHYSTVMLAWTDKEDGTVEIHHLSTGHGSVSDQGGMNTAFRVLGVSLYYSRLGGAGYVTKAAQR